jgi:aspartate racemase
MVGIVGGVGSYAGIDLIKKIYDSTEATSDQDHLPVMMLSAPHKILDRTRYLLGEINENPGFAIAEVISVLCHNGAKIIGIPCNTAHSPRIFDEIRRMVPRDCMLLHMVEEVGDHIVNYYPGLKRVGVLCTNGTYHSNVYGEILSRFGIDVIYPPVDIQYAFVHRAIYDPRYGIKAKSNPVTTRAKEELMMAALYLSEVGAEVIVLGCTEIPLAIQESNIGTASVIDATSVLAQALIRESTSEGRHKPLFA